MRPAANDSSPKSNSVLTAAQYFQLAVLLFCLPGRVFSGTDYLARYPAKKTAATYLTFYVLHQPGLDQRLVRHISPVCFNLDAVQ
jgi:hypothetical protein